jgi:hypothetical protein
MNNSQTSETSNIVPQKTEAIIPLDEFKSLFYQLNAKPDTELRLLPSRKTLELADIRGINEQVSAKLRNHDLTAEIASINFILSNKRIKDYSTWAEFERENWNTVNERIESLSINWDILIKLPQYQLPQRHSMKLRIGNAIPPKDIFQLLLTSDDVSEVMEAGSPSVCKIDFINNIIAIELLNIVSNWYEGLKNSPEPNTIQKVLKKQGKFFSEIIRYASPVLLLMIISSYSDYLFPILGIGEEVSMDALQRDLIFLAAIFMFGSFVGRKIEKEIDRKIDRFEEYPNFSITRGDRKAIEEFESKSNKLTNQIISRFVWILVSIVTSSVLKPVIQHFIPLNNLS